MNFPQYKCHKVVQAVKIAAVEKGADGSLTVKLEDGFDNVIFQHNDRQKANFVHAEPGWYLVLYENAHLSASPAEAFEAGYTLIEDEAPKAKGGKRKSAPAEPATADSVE